MKKKWIWQMGIRLLGRLPARLRVYLGKACFHGVETGRNEADILRELLTLRNELDTCIDRVAIRYDHGLHPKHRLMDYHRFFTDRIRPGERVLDIGCGTGAVAFSLATHGARVTAIDINPESIQIARRTHAHPNLTYCVGDATRDLPRQPVDTVVLSNVLEHIDPRVDFLKRIHAGVSPRTWLLRVPLIDRDWTVPLKRELGLFPYGDATHRIEYTEAGFRDELKAAGLTVRHRQINWGELWAEAIHDGN